MTFFPPVASSASSILGPTGELLTSEKELQQHYNPQFRDGKSIFRIIETVTGSGTLTVIANSEWQLTTTASGTDDVLMESRDNVRLYPQQYGEVGFAIRSTDAMTGNQFGEWGFSDTDTGAGWGRDATGLYVWTLRATVKTKVSVASFNADILDGTGASGLTWDGNVTTKFTVEFSSTWWTGPVTFCAYLYNSSNEVVKVVAHRHVPTAGAVDSPSTGVRAMVQLDNNATATARELFCSEFWVASAGAKLFEYARAVSDFRFNQAPTNVQIPSISFRKKAGSENVPVYLHGFDVVTTDNMVVVLKNNTVLTAPSWDVPNSVGAQESAVEQDNDATAFTGGDQVFVIFIAVGATSVNLEALGIPRIYLSNNEIMTMAIRSILTSSTRMDCNFRVIEEW